MTFVAYRVCRNISFSYIKEKKTTPSPYITGLVYHEALELLFLSLKKKDFLICRQTLLLLLAQFPTQKEDRIRRQGKRSARLFGGQNFINSVLAVVPQMIKKWMNSTFSFKQTKAKQLARQGIKQILPPKQTQRPLPCLLIPFFLVQFGSVIFL